MEQQQPLEERLQIPVVLYIVLTISILIGQEPSAYFENPRYFVDKHDYFMIVRIVKVWNNLPLHVVEAESFEFLS